MLLLLLVLLLAQVVELRTFVLPQVVADSALLAPLVV